MRRLAFLSFALSFTACAALAAEVRVPVDLPPGGLDPGFGAVELEVVFPDAIDQVTEVELTLDGTYDGRSFWNCSGDEPYQFTYGHPGLIVSLRIGEQHSFIQRQHLLSSVEQGLPLHRIFGLLPADLSQWQIGAGTTGVISIGPFDEQVHSPCSLGGIFAWSVMNIDALRLVVKSDGAVGSEGRSFGRIKALYQGG